MSAVAAMLRPLGLRIDEHDYKKGRGETKYKQLLKQSKHAERMTRRQKAMRKGALARAELVSRF